MPRYKLIGNSTTVFIVVGLNHERDRVNLRFLMMNLPIGCLERLQHNTPLGLVHHRRAAPLLDVRGLEVRAFTSGDNGLVQGVCTRTMWMLRERKKLRIVMTWEDTASMVASKRNKSKYSGLAVEEQGIDLQIGNVSNYTVFLQHLGVASVN
ncbi:hypothetical protein FIBSPDRAFT_122149 [Athelia psychrophila]|uniref:Uncharacterized protein n=1 Tax=Athelia psychrophila TaxID=1759441 RepID=A0A166CL35_9AGAM|nr:hypothetical protein FIBSPDRAFT_122149 [Fibularhizoctonia sp. CBS 109695]